MGRERSLGLVPQARCADSNLETSGRRELRAAAQAQDSEPRAPTLQRASLLEARGSDPTQGFSNAPARYRQQEGTFCFFSFLFFKMCKNVLLLLGHSTAATCSTEGPFPAHPQRSPPLRHGLPDLDLGSASAPCGRPAPDPAGLRRQKRPVRGPRRKLEPGGREGGWSAPLAGWGPTGPGPPGARVPPRGRQPGTPRGRGGGG